jgi:SpoIID/LytB domain protein
LAINNVALKNYLKGIVETNDQEHLEKNKVMALLAKNYILFYLQQGNKHPSIPADAPYVAIDSPEMFQKYVGAGAEKTLTKRYEALEQTKNQIVLYSGTLPILPYFSCSAGFTLSAEEKRGRKDTPYLQSVFDFAPCADFQGH